MTPQTAWETCREWGVDVEAGLALLPAARREVAERRLRALPVQCNRRLTRLLGRVRWRTAPAPVDAVRYEPYVLELCREAVEARSVAVFAHEVAHVLRGPCVGGDAHDEEWAKISRAMGGHAAKRIREDGPGGEVAAALRTRAEKVVGRCEKCGHEMKRARRLPRGRGYAHIADGCGGRIVRVED